MHKRDGFWKKLAPLALPMAFQNLMQSLVSASDAVMLGFVDQASLSAVSLAAQIAFVVSLFIFGLTGGGSILAAQYWGKRSREDVEQVFAIMLRPTAFVGGVFTLMACFVPEVLMRIFTPDPVLIDLGSGYLRMVSLSYFLMCVNQSYLCIMRNSGRAVLASMISSVCVVINIILNGILIFGLLGMPEMGIEGAALATVITQVIGLLWAVADTARPDRIKLRKRYLLGKCLLSRDYWDQTVVVTLNNLAWGLGITMGSVILGRMGSDAVAANSIASVMKNLIACFCMGLGSGGAILVGNELGANQLERAKAYGGRVVKIALISGAISCGILVALTPVIVSLAELTAQAQEYLRFMILVCGVNLIGMSNNTAIISGIFTAGGDTRFGLLCDCITLWCIVVPMGILAAFVWKLPLQIVYCIICMDEIVKLPAVFHHYRQYKWVRNLTIREKST